MPSQHQAANILNALEEQTKTGHLCDVLFYNRSGSVWAHSCVLAGFSPVFDQMFSLNLKNSHHWSLKQPIQITVNNTSMCQSEAISNCIQCLAQVVKFIYTGHIKPNALHLHHLFLLSDRLGSKELLHICEKYRREHSLLSASEEKSVQSVSEQNINSVSENIAAVTLRQHDIERKGKTENAIIQREYEKEPSISDCTVCQFASNDRNKFEIHGRIFHCNSYKCFYCGNCYKSISSLLHHMEHECKSESHVICSVCLLESPSSSELLSHLKEHQSFKPFICSLCKSAYDRRSVWLRHLRIHILNATHPCPACGVSFKTATECAKHCKAVHAPKKHICDTCGFTAAFSHLLEKHQSKHRQVLVCDRPNCEFRTSSESQLIRHRSTHKNKKPTMIDKNHECSICNIKFTLHKNLVRHMKIHEREELKMKCPLCGYETSRTDKFNNHMEFKHDRTQVQNDRVSTNIKPCALSTTKPSKQVTEPSAAGSDLTYPDGISKTQNPSRETYSVESFSNKHNTLLMNDEGDISIVNTNEKNSVTLRNIGNLTGSITLDEKTGVLTMNNINSGSVFLNETTGELTYINLENDNYHFNPDSMAQGDNFKAPSVPQHSAEITKLDEVTGEIIKISPTNEEAVAPDQDFDYFDMDVNDDSLDGFDDFDEVLFDVFSENDPEFDGRVSLRDDRSFMTANVMPHLDESTGLLTFDDNLESRVTDQNETWNSSFTQGIGDDSNGKDAYKLLLDEVTGVLHD